MNHSPFAAHIFSQALTNQRQNAISRRPVRNIAGIQNTRFIHASSFDPFDKIVMEECEKGTLNFGGKALKFH
jgi:hypothetical protein